MASIYPFRARMPRPDVASRVAAVPYDVVTREEAANLAADNPLSFLHVSRPEIDLPPEIDAASDEVYQLARKNFAAICEAAPLIDDHAETYYPYRITVGDHAQTGIAAAVSVDDYDNDIVKKHEKTRPDKEDDRTRHAHTLRAHTGPVFLTYAAVAAIDSAVSAVTQTAPLMDVVAADGVRHEVWKSPLLDSPIRGLFVEDLEGDGDAEIVAYTANATLLIYDYESRDQVYRTPEGLYSAINCMIVENLDRDPQKEVFFLAARSGGSGDGEGAG